MNRLNLDQLEQAFPVVVSPQGAATLSTVQQGPQRAKLRLQGPQRSLVRNDPLACRFQRGVVLAHPLLDGRTRLAHVLQLTARRLGGAGAPVPLVTPSAVPPRPALQLR